MTPTQETLGELAAVFGLPGLHPNRHGVVVLRLGESDVLSLECMEREHAVILCLARPLPQHQSGALERALRLCNGGAGLPLPVRAGLVGKGRMKTVARNGENQFAETLWLMTYFTEQTFRLPQVTHGLQMLMDLHRRVVA